MGCIRFAAVVRFRKRGGGPYHHPYGPHRLVLSNPPRPMRVSPPGSVAFITRLQEFFTSGFVPPRSLACRCHQTISPGAWQPCRRKYAPDAAASFFKGKSNAIATASRRKGHRPKPGKGLTATVERLESDSVRFVRLCARALHA
ncbi:hypothetical protein V2G26_004964 [Clonostachys chloroleuca]